MKCTHCGADIPEGQLYCGICGMEVQIVPDYNPLDDMLTAQVKGVINESNMNTGRNTGRVSRNTGMNVNRNTGMNVSRNTGRNVSRNTGRSVSRNTGRSVSRNTGRNTGRDVRESEQDRAERERLERKKRDAKRKQQAVKRRRRVILTLVLLVAAVAVIGVVLYQNSYAGLVKKGYKELQENQYTEAEERFGKAIDKKKEKSEAYVGLSKVYIQQDDLNKAEQVFLTALGGQPDNVAIYEGILEFYMDTKQEGKVSDLLADCKNKDLLKQLSPYVSDKPEFSLSDEEIFDEVQQLSITGTGETIYYTIDGTEPGKTAGSEYAKPIQLEEGKTVVRAISYNKKGIPSLETSKTYEIELPIQEAPAVTPSTGQYEEPTTIEIKVPAGYTAYYTTKGEPPTVASEKYTGPIDMPEGNTFFSAVLIDSKGKASDITRRNYDLTLE